MSDLFGGMGLVEVHAALFAAGAVAVIGLGVLAPSLVRRVGDDGVRSALGGSGTQSGRVDIRTLRREELAKGAATRAPGALRFMKRAFDILAGACLIIFLAPLLLVTAIAIRLETPGPVLYRQRRVGLDGREFEIYKFRSMREDAEKDGARWAAANDDRITRVGRLIRRTRIDEIPQAINILRGEMSFVGPRPERPEFVRLLEKEIPHYHARHIVKPGITGWAQVQHEYTASVEGARDKLAYDLFYIKHFSPLLDLLIVLMTIRVALMGIGAR